MDALETIMEAYIRDRRPIPDPSPVTDGHVTLPALVATKVQLYTAMRARDVKKTELARRLRVHPPQVDRLLNLRHGSRMDQLEAAANALGGTLDVRLVFQKDVATPTQRLTAMRRHAIRRNARAFAGTRSSAASRKTAGKRR